MTQSNAKPKGLMTLTLYNSDGSVAAVHENHNRVLPGGRQLLLQMLNGEVAASKITSLLANEKFKEAEFKANSENEGQLKLKNVKTPKPTLSEKGLVIAHTATAAEAGEVRGGGLILDIGKPGEEAKGQVLYNFAALPNVTKVEADQPLRVTFTLSME